MNKKEAIIIQKLISEIYMIENMVNGYDRIKFLNDEKTQRAIAMTLINMGELVKLLPMDFRVKYSEAPWKLVAGMRDIVAHKYQTLRMEDVWVTVNSDIPTLKILLKALVDDK